MRIYVYFKYIHNLWLNNTSYSVISYVYACSSIRVDHAKAIDCTLGLMRV